MLPKPESVEVGLTTWSSPRLRVTLLERALLRGRESAIATPASASGWRQHKNHMMLE